MNAMGSTRPIRLPTTLPAPQHTAAASVSANGHEARMAPSAPQPIIAMPASATPALRSCARVGRSPRHITANRIVK